ncbi:hypothetical protein [Kitasatospora camelliae]|uniref:Uncharacterized protein n=1 Tax=Kitasatospora camelliae TaxID=3156397 RepID=A0AAU8JWS6_9ACTN
MGVPREPPDGTPEGGSSDDEFRSVVFDESFVRAARIQELSARERLGGGVGRPTRPRIGLGPLGSLPRQALALLLVVVVAFAAAVYFGVSAPNRQGAPAAGNQLTTSLTALAPAGPVVAVSDPKNPFAGLPAGFADGVAGLGMPGGSATEHFTKIEVSRALETVQRYLVAAALAPTTLTQGDTSELRTLVTSGELAQYDESVGSPQDDQRHAATGWLVRFDPSRVALAEDTVKVAGGIQIAEAGTGTLEITTDHTFVYALRPTESAEDTTPSLFSVRRELRFQFDRTDLGLARLRLVDAVVLAGPTACGAPMAGYLQPILAGSAGAAPTAPPAVDPADHGKPSWQQCAVLSPIVK